MITQELMSSVEKLDRRGDPRRVAEWTVSEETLPPTRSYLDENVNHKDVIPMKFARLATKLFITMPFLTAWVYWMVTPNSIPSSPVQIPVYLTLIGYVTVFVWLAICSITKLGVVLKLSTYYSYAFGLLSIAALVCSLHSGNTAIGLLLATGGFLSILDILLSIFVFPPIVVYQPTPPPDKPPTPPQFFVPEGPVFQYIPLKGGPSIPLDSYSEVSLLDSNFERRNEAKSPGPSEISARPSTSKQRSTEDIVFSDDSI